MNFPLPPPKRIVQRLSLNSKSQKDEFPAFFSLFSAELLRVVARQNIEYSSYDTWFTSRALIHVTC